MGREKVELTVSEVRHTQKGSKVEAGGRVETDGMELVVAYYLETPPEKSDHANVFSVGDTFTATIEMPWRKP